MIRYSCIQYGVYCIEIIVLSTLGMKHTSDPVMRSGRTKWEKIVERWMSLWFDSARYLRTKYERIHGNKEGRDAVPRSPKDRHLPYIF
jgi:hypothetical protein